MFQLGPNGLHCWPSRHLPPPPQPESGQKFNLNFVLNKTCLNSNFIFPNKFGLHKDCILHLPSWQSVSTVIHWPSHFHLVKSCAFPSCQPPPTWLSFPPRPRANTCCRACTWSKRKWSEVWVWSCTERLCTMHKFTIINSYCLYHLEMA